MPPSTAPRLGIVADEARRPARPSPHSVRRRWIEPLSRLGLVIRGIIYFLPGLFAVEWALNHHRRPMTPASVIDLIGHAPLGRALLVVVACGLAGYAAWGVIRVVFDPQGRGTSPAGLAARFGYATSAIAYSVWLIATLRVLTGSLARVDQPQHWTVAIMARPFGGVVMVGIGLAWIVGAGVTQIVMAWRASFERDLALERVGRTERRWALVLGRIGMFSRGLVFTIIGILLVSAALHSQADSGSGMGEALLELEHQPFGRLLAGGMGLGLMAFGVYSAMSARWMRMHRVAASPVPVPPRGRR